MSEDIQAHIDRLNQQIAQLTEQQQYKEAIDLATSLLDYVRQRIGEQSTVFAESLNGLASLYRDMGEYGTVEPLLEQALSIRRAALGEQHPKVAESLNNLATLYKEMGEYDKAEPLYQQSLATRRAVLGEQHPNVATGLHNLAELYRAMGEYGEAEPLYQQSLVIWRAALGEQHPRVATSLNALAGLYSDMGEYSKAEQLLDQALAIRRAALGEQHPNVAESLNNLALLYANMGEYGKAEPLYQQNLATWRTALGEQHPKVATSLNNLASLYSDMGEYSKAEPLYQQALAIRRAVLGEQHPDVAMSLNNLAILYADMGEYGKAEQLLDQALAIRRAALGEQHPDVATSLNALAGLYSDMGEYGKAEPFYQQTLAIRRAVLGEQHLKVAMSLNNLATLYFIMGEYSKAEPLYQQTLAIRRAALGEQHPRVATSLNFLGLLYQKMGEYSKAEQLLDQALAIRRAVLGEQHPDVATSLNNLAELYANMGEYNSKVEPLYQQALATRRAALGEQHPDVAESLNNLASLYTHIGLYDWAEPLYQQALSIWRTVLGEQHPNVATSLNNLASLYADMGEFGKAEPLYQQALSIMRAALGEQRPDVALFLRNLASVHVALGRGAEAFTLLWQALSIEDQIISQVFSAGSDRRRMAYLATVRGSLTDFLSLILQLFRSSPQQVQAAMDVVLRRKGLAAEAVAAQRDALLGGRYPTLAPELEQLTALRTQIVQKTLAGPGAESIETHQQRLNEWNAHKERLEADLARQIPEMNLAQQLRQVNRHAIAGQLPHDALLVEFVHFDVYDFYAIPARRESQWKPAHYVAFVLPGSDPDQVQLIDLGEAKPIDKLIDDFRLPLSGEQGRDLLPDDTMSDEGKADLAGKQLRETIFDPLLPYLHKYHRLFLAPDGNLSRLPFEVLPTEDGQRLIDRYQISYVSVGRDLLRFTSRSSRQAQTPVVMADPNFDFTASTLESSAEVPAPGGRRAADLAKHALTFRRLPGTRLEGQQVAQALSVHPLLNEQAVVSSLKALRSPLILHLATHGFFLPDQPRDPNKEFSSSAISQSIAMMGSEAMAAPDRLTWLMGQHLENPLLRSGLAFAGANTWNRGGALPPEVEDGLLTAEDVSGLDLLDTELVVLSACETGLGSVHIGEGVFGLRRTFMLAGAKTLVMSLWKVPDQQTQELMEDFYRRLLAGQPRAEALREAQLALKEKYPHPYFWGAFICQGNPGPLS